MDEIATRWRRWTRWWARDLLGYRPPRPVRRDPLAPNPEDVAVPTGVSLGERLVAAVALPLVVGALLVPFRGSVTTASVALVLVLTIVVVGLIGGMVPAAVAAVVATATFDVLFTQPYGLVAIDAVEDVEIALVLLAIGLLVGQIAGRQAQLRRAADVRIDELSALIDLVDATATHAGADELVAVTGRGLTRVLDLSRWEWFPGGRGGVWPTLRVDGTLDGGPGDVHGVDGIPETGAELAVAHRGQELGRLVVTPARASTVSLEQLQVAGALVTLLGGAMADRDVPCRLLGGPHTGARRS